MRCDSCGIPPEKLVPLLSSGELLRYPGRPGRCLGRESGDFELRAE